MTHAQRMALTVLLFAVVGAGGIAAAVYLDNPWQGIALIVLLGVAYLVDSRFLKRPADGPDTEV